jgi:hypothetical protein
MWERSTSSRVAEEVVAAARSPAATGGGADAGIRGEMKRDVVSAGRRDERFEIERVPLNERRAPGSEWRRDELALTDREIVVNRDETALDQAVREVAADEPGPTDHEKSRHARHALETYSRTAIFVSRDPVTGSGAPGPRNEPS